MKTKLIRSSTIVLLGLFVVNSTVSIWAQGLNPYAPPTKPEVAVRLYSGRQNPKFELTEANLKQIRELIDKLPTNTSEQAGVNPSALGYSGFMVGQLPGAENDQYVIVSIYRKSVEVRTFAPGKGSTAVYKQDDQRTLELLLVTLADAQGLLGPEDKTHIVSGEDVRNRKKKS